MNDIDIDIDLVEKKYDYEEGLPADLCRLPSGGRLYTEDHPFHMKENVEFKSMTAHEENILATQALIRAGTVLNVLIKSSLSNKLVDTDSLLMGDKAALLIAIRRSGFGDEYVTMTQCPSCKTESRHEFSLSCAEIKPLGASPDVPGQNLFSYKLPRSKANIKFSLATDGDDLAVMKMQRQKKKLLKSSIVDTTITDRMILAIREVDGITDLQKIRKFIDRMPALDSRKLRAYMSKIEPDVTMKEEVVCRSCGAESFRSIGFGYEFFWPQYDNE